jgi:hypothetical protein
MNLGMAAESGKAKQARCYYSEQRTLLVGMTWCVHSFSVFTILFFTFHKHVGSVHIPFSLSFRLLQSPPARVPSDSISRSLPLSFPSYMKLSRP